ncbi:MAG: ribosome biogenesis GTP-binding protein YihA/YsxC [Gammaproteobacteria bacterium]
MAKLFQQTRFLTSAFELSQLPPDHGVEVAFAGRSNAGKSTAINCLTRQHKLCKTSKTPGRTQLINFFALDGQRKLVDLPGYGFAKVSKKLRSHWDQVLSTFLLRRGALRGLVIVVDIRRGISNSDQTLIDMVGSSLALHILLTKADKLPRSAVNSAIEQAQERLGNTGHSVSSLSALTLEGLDQLERKCGEWLDFM